MQALNSYHWAQDKIDEVVTGNKQHRESQACERRLRQMQARREKQAARAVKAIPDGDGITSDIVAGSGD